jgi:3-oxoacyl-(acyl-carrier-protein) synthase
MDAVIGLLSMRSSVAPPIANLETPDDSTTGLNLCARTAKKVSGGVNSFMVHGLGLGGEDAAAVFTTWRRSGRHAEPLEL